MNERVLCVRSHWKRTNLQFDFIKQIWESLDHEHQTIQIQILEVLISKLKIIITKLRGITKDKIRNQITRRPGNEVLRWKYVVVKKCLDDSIENLDSWQKMFDPSWFLILKVSSPFIDRELNRNKLAVSSSINAYSIRDALKELPLQQNRVFLPGNRLETAQICDVPFTSTKYMQGAKSAKWRVMDCIPCDRDINLDLARRNVRKFATRLSTVDPLTFGVLQCIGVVQVGGKNPSSFNFIFRIPRELNHEPKSLRTYLYSKQTLTLTNRFELAKQVAKAISYIHLLGFVHKNIRPETVLGFQTIKAGSDMFFLVGFEDIRTADGRTLRAGDSLWEKNLYRHPHRQGLHPEDIYTMQHDIYSLGVCLLEIGLWESFLLCKDDTTTPLPSTALGISLNGVEFKQPTLMKEHLVRLAKRYLPERMGERYERVVVNCLTCLDEDNIDFGDQSEFEDEDGVLVAVKYIEKVLLKLEDIRV